METFTEGGLLEIVPHGDGFRFAVGDPSRDLAASVIISREQMELIYAAIGDMLG